MIAPVRFLTVFLLAVPLLLAAPRAFAFLTVGPKAASGCLFHTIKSALDNLLARERSGDFSTLFAAVVGGFCGEALSVDGTGTSEPRPGQQRAIVYLSRPADAFTQGVRRV